MQNDRSRWVSCGRRLPEWYTVLAFTHFNGPWQQPEAVIDIVGREGEKLVGRFAEPLHPEFSESEKRFHASFECWRLSSPDRLSPRLPIWIAPSDSSEMPCSLSKGANQPPQSAR